MRGIIYTDKLLKAVVSKFMFDFFKKGISNGMTQMVKRQMKDVPEAEQEKIVAMIEKDPEFFANLAEEIQKKMKEGKDQTTAAMEVLQANQEKLKGLMRE